jgi:hypothetical protein
MEYCVVYRIDGDQFPQFEAVGDAVVTGTGRNRHIWKGIGGNSIFLETASDALRSNCHH